jgi:hypothetical protein
MHETVLSLVKKIISSTDQAREIAGEIAAGIVADMERYRDLIREQREAFSPGEGPFAVTGEDVFLADSGGTLSGPELLPMEYLYRFLDEQCENLFSGVFLVPFSPDDNPCGDPAIIAEQFRLMVDLELDACLRDPAATLAGTIKTLLKDLARGVHIVRPVQRTPMDLASNEDALVSLIHHVTISVDPSALIVHERGESEHGGYLRTASDLSLLLLDAVHRGDASRLQSWLESISPPASGTSYFNYCAHVMEVDGSRITRVLGDAEGGALTETVVRRGGRIVSGTAGTGPGSLRCNYLNALVDPNLPSIQRVPVSVAVHAVTLAVAGLPCVDLAGLLGLDGQSNSRPFDEVVRETGSDETVTGGLFAGILDLVRARVAEPAFDPAAEQRVVAGDKRLLAVLRTPRVGDGDSEADEPSVPVICLHNLSSDFVLFRDRRDRYPWPEDGVLRDLVTDDLVIPAVEGALFSLELAPWEVLWLRFGSSLDEAGDRFELLSAAHPGQLEEN